MDPAKDNLADNEEIQVGLIFVSYVRKPTLHAGAISIMHERASEDYETNRQV